MRGSVYTSMDKGTAVDAIKYSRPDVERARYEGRLDRGIIASDIPRSVFEELLNNGDIEIRPYQGFDGADLRSYEVRLVNENAIQTFNMYRRSEPE